MIKTINATRYITPEYIHIGSYENLVIISPITGLITKAETAPAVPDNPTTVEVNVRPKVSDMEVI
jgi:hypothetical protein